MAQTHTFTHIIHKDTRTSARTNNELGHVQMATRNVPQSPVLGYIIHKDTRTSVRTNNEIGHMQMATKERTTIPGFRALVSSRLDVRVTTRRVASHRAECYRFARCHSTLVAHPLGPACFQLPNNVGVK